MNDHQSNIVKGLVGGSSALLALVVSVQDDVLFWLRASSLLAGIIVSGAMTWSIWRRNRKPRK